MDLKDENHKSVSMTLVKLDQYSSELHFIVGFFCMGDSHQMGIGGRGPKPYTCLQNFGRFAPTVSF